MKKQSCRANHCHYGCVVDLEGGFIEVKIEGQSTIVQALLMRLTGKADYQ